MLAMLAITGTGLTFASPASAVGYDGMSPYGSECYAKSKLAHETPIYYEGKQLGNMQLWYSKKCRSTWARVVSFKAAGPKGGSRDNLGIAEIRRNSDGKKFHCFTSYGNKSCNTPMVYDADVTSYAYGGILHGAWFKTGRTRAY